MAMFHLEYPRKSGFYHWDELACLARALGFPGEIFYNNIPEEYIGDKEDNGLTLKLILWLTDVQKVFNQAVDKTVNIHTDEWNICVIKKTLNLLDVNAVTFEELHNIRVAFQTYENADTKGLSLQEKTLQRTLKLCGRMISPLKMMQRIKHMKDEFDEQNRIQLHEFLDLILWCEEFEEMSPEQPNLDIQKNQEVNLYNIEDFESILTHYDENLAQRLNTEYRAEELTFVKEKHESKAMPKDLPPVDPEKRKRQVTFHKENYQYLKNELAISQQNCHQTKAGYVRSRPITAPDLIMYEAVSQGYRVSTLDPRPATVFETIGHLIPPLPGKKSPTTVADIKNIVPRPDVTKYKRPHTPAALTKQDELHHMHRMETLDFEMATTERKYNLLLEEEMDTYMPGYRQRQHSLLKKDKKPEMSKETLLVKKQIPSEDTLKRLSYHHKREPPRPSHGKACDARHRGWHKVKVKKGSHKVLVAPYFERSNTGLMFTKLWQKNRHTGKLETFVHRFTKEDDVSTEKPKSRAKKYFNPENVESYGVETLPCSDLSAEAQSKTVSKNSEGMVKAGSHISISSSTGKESSDVSWRHLKLYSGPAPDQLTQESSNNGIKNDRTNVESQSGSVVELRTVGKVEVLEKIKEESGRTTRQSGIYGKHSKTPIGMSQLTKSLDRKLATAVKSPTKTPLMTPPSRKATKELLYDLAPITPHPSPGKRPHKVTVKTPMTQAFESVRRTELGPVKTSTADEPMKRIHDQIKLNCLHRLSWRIQGLASPAMHQRLLSVDLNRVGMPDPKAEKWSAAGGLGFSIPTN